MANRRMFSLDIVDSDAFLDLPLTSQALYFHLGMRADDDGFINNPMRILRTIGGNKSDFEMLIHKRFLLIFPNGVVVIKHWKMHNYIPRDRYKETVYLDEKSLLTLKENGSYTECNTPCIQNVYSLETQDRLGKDRLGKVNNLESSKTNSKTNVNSLEEEIDKDKEIDIDNKENIFAGKSENFIKTFEEYRKMRTSIKAKMTPYAEKRTLVKLETLSKDEIEQIDILNQSIENSWKGVFPLKKDTPKPKSSNFNNFSQRNYDMDDLENKLLGWEKNKK